MFNFVRKSLSVRHWRHCSSTLRPSPIHGFQHCLSLLSIRSLSTTDPTTNQQSSTVSYLINTCGLSPESAMAVSKKRQLKTPDKAEAFVSVLKSHDFSQTHISNMIKKFPAVLLCDTEKTLLPKMEFFYSKGFSNLDLANTLCKCPLLLRRSLENHIIPNFNYLSNVFGSLGRTIDFIKRNPPLLYQDLQTCVAPKVDIFLEHGVPKSNIFRYMHHWSYSSLMDENLFKEVVEEVKEMGLDPSRPLFVMVVSLKTVMRGKQWESKVNMFKRWGWSEDEFSKAFWKYPRFILTSDDKIMAAMDFFVNKMGLEPSYIAKRPILLAFSLQKRVIPRAAVFQFMLSKGLIKSKHAGFFTMLKYSEKDFVEKFVHSFNEAPQLLKLYKNKLDLSKTTK